jgi:hypothetical protein
MNFNDARERGRVTRDQSEYDSVILSLRKDKNHFDTINILNTANQLYLDQIKDHKSLKSTFKKPIFNDSKYLGE